MTKVLTLYYSSYFARLACRPAVELQGVGNGRKPISARKTDPWRLYRHLRVGAVSLVLASLCGKSVVILSLRSSWPARLDRRSGAGRSAAGRLAITRPSSQPAAATV